MRDDDRLFLTEAGYQQLEIELKHLTTVERSRLAEQFREHKEHGEFGEDSEFEELKSEQAMVEGRIKELKAVLQRAVVVSPEEVSTEFVGVGSKVKIENLSDKTKKEFTLVGAMESSPENGLVSYLSPLGEALFEHRVGDVVEAHLPKGVVKFKVLQIGK